MPLGDAERDGLALVECAHRGDLEGARVVLDNCDVRVTAAFLARVCCDLIEGWSQDDPDLFVRIRRHYVG